MDPRKIERIVLYSVIGVLAAALIGTVAFILFSNLSGDGGGKKETTVTTDNGTDIGDMSEPPGTDAETEPETDDKTGTSDTGSVTEPPAVTERPGVNFKVLEYDEPKTMYALYNVNARESATTDSIILFMIYQSESVTVKGETDNGWYVVEARGVTAYVRSDLLTDDASASAVEITEYTEPKTMYALQNVNVREGSSTNSKIITTINAGTEVKVTGETSNGWYRVDYDGQTAYIKSEYLSNTRPAETVPETDAVTEPSTGGGNREV